MTENRDDIFDKMMRLPLLVTFEPFYKKHKEILLYLFFGGLVTVVSIVTFQLFYAVFKINELIANVISWVISVLVAYITNRTWVFRSTANTKSAVTAEMLVFFGGRAATLLIEELIILVFVTFLKFNSLAVKLAAQIVVIVLNYIFSKLLIFKDKKSGN